MSKEVLAVLPNAVADAANAVVEQEYSFWANLMMVGDTDNCDLLSYPSFSASVDSRSNRVHLLRNARHWENLSTTAAVAPPIVELLH